MYSLDQKIFLMTENSDEEKVICYLDCATEESCKPIAITTTGNYMILETEQGEKIAVQMEKSQMERLIEPRKPIAFDDLAEQEKISLIVKPVLKNTSKRVTYVIQLFSNIAGLYHKSFL